MRADRLINIMLLLCTRRRMTTLRLAQELEVSKRTILRDIDALAIAGVPIYAEGGHGGGVWLDENYRVSLTGLQPSEVQALFIPGASQALDQIGLGKSAQNALLKLLASLPQQRRDEVEFIRQRLFFDSAWWWRDQHPDPHLAPLYRAVWESRLIRVTYQHHDGANVERVLQPYALVVKTSVWYLIAERDGEFRTYRASRFGEVAILDQTFTRQPAFDLEAYWQNAVQEFASTITQYTFTLRIKAARMQFVQWYTPGRYTLIAETKDYADVRFQMDSPESAKMLVLGLGVDALVLEPPALREAVLRQAQDLVVHLK